MLMAGVVAFSLAHMQPAVAHPADEGRVVIVFRAQPGKLMWTQDWWLGNLVGLQFWGVEIDRDKDARASSEEIAALARNLADGFTLSIDGQQVVPIVEKIDVSEYNAFVSAPADPQIRLTFAVPIPAAGATLRYQKRRADRLAFIARFPAGGGVLVSDQTLAPDHYEAKVVVRQSSRATVVAPNMGVSQSVALIIALVSLAAAGVTLAFVIILLRRR